ncbi:ribosome recycling factor [Propylenella binzhouense]|uniref:Ribosome-recycling factor n=1 Tax=Propylenella binzhouense TaxID=2555902 RepID=A0A964T4E9_9HYPH|nr:ribosome recycling factor [Propylenella binzhouense]MYZ47732.1 ribosome recycling factor [Propylenella binzhouense]
MSEGFDSGDLNRRMHGAVSVLKTELSGLRTGRASANLLDPIVVPAYGTNMPISQVGTVSVPEPRMITVQVWDQTLVGKVDRAIRDANLGLNPVVEGTLLRIPIPELNAQRRQELVKVAHKYAEQARVAVRHVRRDGMETLKRLEKNSEISQDESRAHSDEIQKMTDSFIKEIDDMLSSKEKEITHV